MIASNFEPNAREFSSLIDDAERQASTDFEINFVADMSEKYEEFGMKMFLTDKQYKLLIKIAGY